MNTEIKEIKIFLACSEEIINEGIKDIVEKLIKEDNIFFAIYGCKFDLEHWKKKICLGEGSPRVQDTINKKLVENCDIFLGIFWTKFGTPPGETINGTEFDSGTEEEFYLAKRLNKKLWILFYTKPKNPLEIDPNQLQKVKEFREYLQKQQIWYGEFSNEDELRKIFKNNMNEFIKDKYSIKVIEKQAVCESLPTKEDFAKYNRGF